MFKVALILLSTIALFFIGVSIIQEKEGDAKLYQQLVETSDPTKSSEIVSYSQQKREKVCKEIWYREVEPLNIQIESEISELFFFQQENQIEVVEELTKVQGIMQEELFYLLEDGREATLEENGKYLIRGCNPKKKESWVEDPLKLTPMQTVRYFEAEKACYNYNTQLFLAQKVLLKKFKLKGHEKCALCLNQTPIMSGRAESVEFTVRGKKLEFQAHKLQAKFDPKEEKL